MTTPMRPLQLQNHLPEVEFAGLNPSVFSISKTSHNVMIWKRTELIVPDATNGSTLARDRRILFVLGRSIDGDVTHGPLFRRSLSIYTLKKSKPTYPVNRSHIIQTEVEKPEGEVSVSESSQDITKQLSPQSPRQSDAKRKALLEEDPRAQEVKPHEVLCRSCQKWIKLSIDHSYLLGNWHAHQQRCSGVV
jgi:hypothetical protein